MVNAAGCFAIFMDAKEAGRKSYPLCRKFRTSAEATQKKYFHLQHRAEALRVLLTDTIHTVSKYALENEDDFLQRLSSSTVQTSDDVKPVRKHIATLERQASKFNRLLKKLYEDDTLDRIQERQYDALSTVYEAALSCRVDYSQ